MNLSKPKAYNHFKGALLEIMQSACEMHIQWAITGSYSLFMRGGQLSPSDIDIITDKAGAYKLGEKLTDYLSNKISLSKAKQIRSYYGTAIINGVKVDIMGDPENKIEGQWIPHRDWVDHIEWVQVYARCIPLLSLEHERLINEMLGNINHVKVINGLISLGDKEDHSVYGIGT